MLIYSWILFPVHLQWLSHGNQNILINLVFCHYSTLHIYKVFFIPVWYFMMSLTPNQNALHKNHFLCNHNFSPLLKVTVPPCLAVITSLTLSFCSCSMNHLINPSSVDMWVCLVQNLLLLPIPGCDHSVDTFSFLLFLFSCPLLFDLLPILCTQIQSLPSCSPSLLVPPVLVHDVVTISPFVKL